ncbi:drug/metabolite transporter (DMT)-like permease [Desulfitispora alkaliphila]|uniref:DMT family transporter n=1 Tax=Desulfitispora alkaliphila TaxID=622674 RepID=UPI003D222059
MTFNRYLPQIACLAVSLIFGFSFMFTKGTLEVLNPFQLLGFRFITAALFLTGLKYTGVLKIDLKGKPIKKLGLLVMFQPFLYFTAETVGVKLTSSSEAGMMLAVIPVAVVIFGAIFLKEYPTKVQVMFTAMSVTGVILIVVMQGAQTGGSHFMGIMILLIAVLAGAAFNILSRHNSKEFKPMEITFVMMWFGAIMFNAIGIGQAIIGGADLTEYFKAIFQPQAYTGILYLGILSSGIAFFLLNYSLSRIQAVQSSVFLNLTTIVAILAGVVILSEPFYWFHGMGGMLIIMGVWGTNYFSEEVQATVEVPVALEKGR